MNMCFLLMTINSMKFNECSIMYCIYTAKHSRGKTFTVRTKMNAHGKTFVVAAPFDNECLFPLNGLPYTVPIMCYKVN